MRVGFCSDDFVQWGHHLIPGGCGYYRCLLPKNAAGEGSGFGPPAWTAHLGFGVRDKKDSAHFGFDAVMLKQMMHRWVPKQMRLAQRCGQWLIVDVDDHYDGLHDANLAKQTTDPAANKLRNRQWHTEVIRQADTLTVSTPFLQHYYQQQGIADVRLIRNGINPKQFIAHKHRSRPPVIGWVGAMGWRSNDIEILRDWLPGFLEQHNLMFKHSGHDERFIRFGEVAGISGDRMILSLMEPLTKYHELLDFDIGLVPLSPIDFNYAKSTIKGLEYAASNIPFIASPTPEYQRLADMGIGRIAHTPEDWIRHLTELLDYDTRKKEAARQRTLALQHHSIVARAPEWAELFSQVTAQATNIPTVRIPYVDPAI